MYYCQVRPSPSYTCSFSIQMQNCIPFPVEINPIFFRPILYFIFSKLLSYLNNITPIPVCVISKFDMKSLNRVSDKNPKLLRLHSILPSQLGRGGMNEHSFVVVIQSMVNPFNSDINWFISYHFLKENIFFKFFFIS